jgi:hypothetical protein
MENAYEYARNYIKNGASANSIVDTYISRATSNPSVDNVAAIYNQYHSLTIDEKRKFARIFADIIIFGSED